MSVWIEEDDIKLVPVRILKAIVKARGISPIPKTKAELVEALADELIDDEVNQCSECKNSDDTHGKYFKVDDWNDYSQSQQYESNTAKCRKCIPTSFTECFNCSRLTESLCPFSPCRMKLCGECGRSIDERTHEWEHLGISKYHGENLAQGKIHFSV